MLPAHPHRYRPVADDDGPLQLPILGTGRPQNACAWSIAARDEPHRIRTAFECPLFGIKAIARGVGQLRVPSCRNALGWLRSRLLCHRCQTASPDPVRAAQRSLHHQLLRSGVLITDLKPRRNASARLSLRACKSASAGGLTSQRSARGPHFLIDGVSSQPKRPQARGLFAHRHASEQDMIARHEPPRSGGRVQRRRMQKRRANPRRPV
jgi:hypothetical protein